MIDDPFELLSRAKTALDLPRMICRELIYETSQTELQELKIAQNSFSFFKTDKNGYKCLFTDFGEEEFLMMCILLNRHVQLFNLFKLVILDIEKMRSTPCEEHDFTYKALEYIKLKKLTNLDLEFK